LYEGRERLSHQSKKLPKSSLVISLARQKLPHGKVACLAGGDTDCGGFTFVGNATVFEKTSSTIGIQYLLLLASNDNFLIKFVRQTY
jgi:hypothetical protein